MKKIIEFQYFDGCPHSKETLKNLLYLLDSNQIIDCELEIVEVPNQALAEELNFQGSPTVLLDGIDIYTGEIPESFSYSCRIFEIEGQQSGVLSSDFLRKKLIQLGVSVSS